ncbi:diacylglycerol/lipid kinase family protein [Fulvivirga sediminis]|uniref:YegS/Rv2252/BmrU family lipid kinase n=1 Tax=Fulvivirga sediminis TaxID=2803949 RepID=A0A937F7Y6_9BACT|nr:YegS/Rv2252/BmrU family lipid kinase [Fulvivirga sediminis]MBL3657981.1 YegS/Rv2252/BmrU family lipid kinase [Fulvivirga sediminis]
MKTQKALFIINPKSGTTQKKGVPALLDYCLDSSKISYEIFYTQYAGHGREIAEKEKNNYHMIVAVGGDGTINEIAGPLINSETTLGIIPLGSGNGLARHLKIPLNTKKAISLLNDQHSKKIDTINFNNDIFVNVAGVGFDAHIASLFAESKKRGFLSYGMLALQEIIKFKSTGYRLIIDGEEKIEKAPFLISIANSSQYGNNAHIAPGAEISDGLMDICIMQKIPFWYYPSLIFHLFNGTLTRSRYYKTWQGKEALIHLLEDAEKKSIHLDGDPYPLKEDIKLSVNPLSLKVACKI